jgi:hypothetical protein
VIFRRLARVAGNHEIQSDFARKYVAEGKLEGPARQRAAIGAGG